MYFKLARFLSGIFFLAASFCSAQRPRNCEPDSECKLLTSCPQMTDLIKSGNPGNIQIVRESICGRDRKGSKVCCPTTSLGPRIKPSVSGDLLPTECGRPAADDRIINGTPSPIGAYPWIAALGYIDVGKSEVKFRCAGAIINKRYVLTAAHCINSGRKILSVIHLGDHNLSTDIDCEKTKLGEKCSLPHIAVGIEETVSHPMYDKRADSSDDIALIRLNTTLNFESGSVSAAIQPVCLPPDGFNLKDFEGNQSPVAVGWGLTENKTYSDVLLRVNVPFADDALCKEIYGEKFVGNQLCIGGTEEGFDTCYGDSGGPLVMTGKDGPPFYQVGIVSFGFIPCGLNNKPGAYTNVADYRNWIINNMRP